MFLLMIYALFDFEIGIAKIIEAARKPLKPDDYMWSAVLGIFTEGHSHREQLYQASPIRCRPDLLLLHCWILPTKPPLPTKPLYIPSIRWKGRSGCADGFGT